MSLARICKVYLLFKCIPFIIILYCVWPTRFAARYDFIKDTDIVKKLVPETCRNISTQRNSECEYSDMVKVNPLMANSEDKLDVLLGGEYYPNKCRSKYSSAIIVPYRSRQTQLHHFTAYMHRFLKRQHIHYRLFVVEQYDNKRFNRAKLLNIGSEIAAEMEFPCLIFHDVDLLPSNLGHLYACSSFPRHLSSNLDTFRYNLPYLGLLGGVVSIRTEQFQNINGMSNLFAGWGGEDDDFYGRIKFRKMNVHRFDPAYNEFIMMEHKKEIPNENRHNFLNTGPLRYFTDGLNSLVYKVHKIEKRALYTHVLVET